MLETHFKGGEAEEEVQKGVSQASPQTLVPKGFYRWMLMLFYLEKKKPVVVCDIVFNRVLVWVCMCVTVEAQGQSEKGTTNTRSLKEEVPRCAVSHFSLCLHMDGNERRKKSEK